MGDYDDFVEFVGSRKIQQDDNQLLFKNTSLGKGEAKNANCALITFFQYVRASRMNFDVYYNEWLKEFINTVFSEREKNKIARLIKIIKPLWNGIINGKIKSWKAITFNNKDKDVFKYYLEEGQPNNIKGLGLYQLINKMDKIIFCSIYSESNYKILDNFKQQTQFDKYISFISKYTRTIPLLVRSGKITKKIDFSKEYETTHIWLEVYDVDKKELLNFDSNAKQIEKLADQNRIYYLVYKNRRPANVPLKFKPDIPKNKTDDISRCRFPDSRYNYSTILKENDIKYPIDHSAVHSLLLFMSTLKLTLKQFFALFKDKYEPLTGLEYDILMDTVDELNRGIINDVVKLLVETYTYEIIDDEASIKKLVFAKESTTYQDAAEAILDAIFACITGYEREKACKYIENSKNIDKISKNIQEYINIMAKHTPLIPLIQIYINKGIDKNEIEPHIVPILYGFEIFDTATGDIYHFDVFTANTKPIIKNEYRELKLEPKPSGDYLPVYLFHSPELRNHPNFKPLQINTKKISPLLSEAKSRQLDKKYLTLV